MRFTPFKNIRSLGDSEASYDELYSSFYLLSVVLVPIFYTFIIFPFYNNESLYLTFALENTIFNIIVVSTFLFLTRIRAKFEFNRLKTKSIDSLYLIITLYTMISFIYLLGNIATLGLEFYSGCHYCGPVPFLGWGTLKIVFFDLSVVLIMLSPLVYRLYIRRRIFIIFYIITLSGVLAFFLTGSYRNQILPILFCFFVILIYNWKYKKAAMFSMLCISPVLAIAYAFNHYFSGQDTAITLYEYFSMNEFFSNYNNFIILSDGFSLDLPFPGASYLGPILHRLSGFMDTGFQSSAGQMAAFMGTGIGYGFSPLLESLLNFGDFFFIGAIIIGCLHSAISNLIFSTQNKLLACVVFGLAVFFIFNINRVDFTAAFNIFFHKVFFLIPIYIFVDFKRDIYQ
ncbi:hypothetical protein KP803_07995 [Vibrio sp. ZSDE26]|uniref:Uncharacterized protein n=1 Tax=Vibrio amylolyticus TaxID=2847292 RepID=A0A9X1XIV3_9VIBR|nr:hypothetical protein [Vibrio amylolyticus]MCK6263216.1 hypothetical protein [Vibrio amylolyticus]